MLGKTLCMLGLVCCLAVVLMFDFVAVIPKFGSEHFGAPEEIKAFAKGLPKKPWYVNLLGVLIFLGGFAGVAAVLVWAVRDSLQEQLTFWEVFLRFFVILVGYKCFDIVVFDWLMLTKWKLPLKIYPETAGSAAYSSFGFNRKSQTLKLILFTGLSLVIAFILTRFF